MNRKLNRRNFLKAVGLSAVCLAASDYAEAGSLAKKKPPNILLITADDLNYNSTGVFGCKISDITPNIDRLAAEGLRFANAHVTIAVCQPCRENLMTGRYPHRNGAEGFHPIDPTVPTLQEQLNKAGYLNGILGKNSHLVPKEKFCWDYYIETAQLGQGRDPKLYGSFAKEFFERAKTDGKPFFLMANSHDPHRPFAGSDQEKASWKNNLPSVRRKIRTEEVEVPEFLPDIPQVRLEIAEYYTSVHRCDETVGAVLKALKESGFESDTLVMFLSDNGMALPFAKTNCYLNSTKTPWIVRWPEKIKPDTVDDNHFISGIDFMPTILEAAGIKQTPGMDGTSFLAVLLGKKQPQRKYACTEFHETSGRKRFPMRCVQTKDFGYIVNFWADGETVFRNESQSGRTFKAMQQAAQADKDIAARVELFSKRVPEEFYDFRNDPDALNNLIDNPEYSKQIESLQQILLEEMVKSDDPAVDAFRNRKTPQAVKKFMEAQKQRAGSLRPRNAKRKQGNIK